jgi:hypothetical protein
MRYEICRLEIWHNNGNNNNLKGAIRHVDARYQKPEGSRFKGTGVCVEQYMGNERRATHSQLHRIFFDQTMEQL